MAFPRAEIRRFNPDIIPEEMSFRTWLQQDPHFDQIARNDIRSVQRVIRILSLPNALADENSAHPLDHRDRLALTLRFISERYQSEQEIFDLFGVNRKTLQTFSMTAQEPNVVRHYQRLQDILLEMKLRRSQRTERAEKRQQLEINEESLAELATVEVVEAPV